MGTYNGAVPDGWDAIWTITVSKTGGVSGTVTTGSYFVMSGTISGSVSDAGALSVHGSALYAWHGCSLDGCVGRDKPQKAPIKFDGTVTLDAAGNITGIATNPDWVNPETIFWQRL
jgi:hypothetical protein